MTTRICTKCDTEKDIEEFYIRNSKVFKKNGDPVRRKTCKSCDRKVRRAWYQDRPERKKKLSVQNKNTYLIRKYGINLEEYLQKVEEQDHTCYICNETDSHQRLSVDHCHTTGKVRKLLCQKCNATLGLVKEDKEILLKMIDYLDEHS